MKPLAEEYMAPGEQLVRTFESPKSVSYVT